MREMKHRVHLRHLLQALPSAPHLSGEIEVRGIKADSRHVEPGDLFVAIPGVKVDGHRFIPQAVEAGAIAVVGERKPAELPLTAGSTTYIQVPNTREAWGWLCAAWHDFPARQMTVIGVTGTDGKTTTVNYIHAILQTAGLKAGMISTVNVRIPATGSKSHHEQEIDTGLHTTTPDPPDIQRYLARMAEAGSTHAVLEVTSHGLAQHRVAGCDFDVAVVTNITHEHLDFHGSVEAYRKAKARLFEGLRQSHHKPNIPKVSILNRDDDSYRYLSPFPADQHVTYARFQPAEVTARNIRPGPRATHFTLNVAGDEVEVQTTLIGVYNVSNALAAAAVGVALQIPLPVIAEGIAAVKGVPGRMERIDAGQNFIAIVDFAHTPNALQEALQTANTMTGKDGRVIVVFGSAGLRDREKRQMMGSIAGQLADIVIVTAEDPRTESVEKIMAISSEAAKEKGKREDIDLFQIADRGEAILRACQEARPGDVVIACGKGHEQSMCFGTTEYPWDDRRAMEMAIQGQAMNTLPTAKPET
jgi:UDP-N-acetylmuramoyl-L-alanyl-D-glutamate--2,6-diaminopimelate ligase